ncbi:DUF1638 domain-containing protein [Desulforhopalus singaporensis]|uniref:N-methylhydantoinase A/oxoprolinase/acetone carboxylase, beta subunit n=1 Tax=Desulforhopalus singaporensis TaxID=91360 RepID=A0A1H0KHQ8_9BACT|nr:DUF1638 domain-containing protein [Desulforhopalus singaporensis]SDO55346.1 N-methylhydantoinase A/oxoprolinase/acetone carboxylase, beta subunit [Desulforhopalus singaporensis]
MECGNTVYFIGCGVLGPDVIHVADELGLHVKRKMLPGGLHNYPGELRSRLQQAIDEVAAEPDCSRIVIGYGLCGRGTVGIAAPGVELVFPKVHDCIALFLGSDRAYKEQFAKFPGTFYLSAGWYREKKRPGEDGKEQVWIGDQAMGCGEITRKYGEKSGKEIIDFFSTWQKNYQRAAFIDTGTPGGAHYREHARAMAEKYGWRYEEITGSLALIKRLLTQQESDDQILVVPPGYVTIYSPIANGLSASTPSSANDSPDRPRLVVFDELVTGDEPQPRYGLGIDAGGTYTDAAIYDFAQNSIQSKNKSLTTKWNFSLGIDGALGGLDQSVFDKIEMVAVSTTLATNAIVEGEGQQPGLLIMPGPGGIPENLLSHSPKAVISGRISISGKERAPIDPEEVIRAARTMIEHHGVTAFAVSGFGGSVNPAHELEVKKILRQETGMVVCCGHEFSDLLNFAVRAQTAVLNARIIPRMIKFFGELEEVLERRNINAPVMVVKGDGTLMSAAMTWERPVETILSGPAASVAGARLLTGLDEAMVVDIGGTTTDTADLAEGLVEVCETGARVGGFATHVKALDMRTIGLGGDSHIQWQKNQLQLGPRRVAPAVWADLQSAAGLDKALRFLEEKLAVTETLLYSQTFFIAMEGEFPFAPSREEQKIYDLLRQRPHCLDELAIKLDLISSRFLNTARLEECGLVQRCGLTPTDLLQVSGRFTRWESTAAERLVNIFSVLTQTTPEQFIGQVFAKFEKDLARELLAKQLSHDVDVDFLNGDKLANHLIESILTGSNRRYKVRFSLEQPIVGIGAPVHYFLPNAGKMLGAEVVIPEDADVANALGAITSNVVIRQQLLIRPDQLGGFNLQGVSGGKRFKSIDEAEAWGVGYLKNEVREQARNAGTSNSVVSIEISDKVVQAGGGTPIFLERRLAAKLVGRPDYTSETVSPG